MCFIIAHFYTWIFNTKYSVYVLLSYSKQQFQITPFLHTITHDDGC